MATNRMITEKIDGSNPTRAQGSDMIIVTTESGKQVWVPKAKYNDSAATITYNAWQVGDTFVARRDSSRTKPDPANPTATVPLYTKGETVERKQPSNEFVAMGRVRSYSTIEIIDHIIAKTGAAPAFNM